MLEIETPMAAPTKTEESYKTAAQIMKEWQGKKVKIKNDFGNLDDGWEVTGASAGEDPTLTVVKKTEPTKQNEIKIFSLKDIISWQETSE